jgi:hypothetical protein
VKSQHSQLEGFSEICIQEHFVKNKVTVVTVVCAAVIMIVKNKVTVVCAAVIMIVKNKVTVVTVVCAVVIMIVKNKVTVVTVVCAAVIMISIMNIVVLIYFSLVRVMPYFIRICYLCV